MRGPASQALGPQGFLLGMRELGHEYGRHFSTEVRGAAGRPDHFAALAREMAALPLDVVLAGGPTLPALKAAGIRTPVVMCGAVDPVGSGLVATLARPGGNFTGLSNQNAELALKRLEVLADLIGRQRAVAVVCKSGERPTDRAEVEARVAGLQVSVLEVADENGLEALFARARRTGIGAMSLEGAFFIAHHERLNALALTHRLPLTFSLNQPGSTDRFVGLGTDVNDVWRRGAWYAERILLGADPATMPVEQPTRVRLVIHRANLAAIGLKPGAALLARADEVIG
jgi:putative ABC transport system substrate-binding protein